MSMNVYVYRVTENQNSGRSRRAGRTFRGVQLE